MTAPAELVIEVTADDIANGVPKDVCLCPIARALARLLGKPLPSDENDDASAVVTTANMDVRDIWGGPDWITYVMPSDGEQFIKAFDNGRDVAPFTLTARRQDGITAMAIEEGGDDDLPF